MALDLTKKLPSMDELVQSARDGVFVIDRDRRCVLFNAACERITGYGSQEVVGRECRCFDAVGCRDEQGRSLSGILCPAKQLFEDGEAAARQRMQIQRKDGSPVWVETQYTALRGSDGAVDFVLGVIREVCEQKAKEDSMLRENAELREQARRRGDASAASEFLADASAQSGSDGAGTQSLRLDPILEETERQAIRCALQAAQWQRSKAADLMGISRSRLYRRMEALGIDPKQLP